MSHEEDEPLPKTGGPRDLLTNETLRIDPRDGERSYRVAVRGFREELPPLSAMTSAGTPLEDGQVSRTAATAKDYVRELTRIGREGSLGERDAARDALAEIARTIARAHTGRRSEQPALIGFGSRVEVTVRDLRWQLLSKSNSATARPRLRALRRTLPTVAIVVTFIAGWAIATDNLVIALALVTVRIALASVVVSPGLPSDLDQKRAMWTPDWRACVIGHLADATLAFSVAGALMTEGRTLWGWGVGLVSISILASTLLRVAALQGGTWLGRLYLERVLRLGWVWIGLALAIVLQPTVPTSGAPLLALTVVGMAAFTTIEVLRTLLYAHHHERRRARQSASEIFNDNLGAWFLATEEPRYGDVALG
jgi:hypothetical protein